MEEKQDNKKQQKQEKHETVKMGVPPKQERPDNLGEYSGENILLSQDQMLGIGGGAKYYEIISIQGNGSYETKVHVAMPALLKHRPHVKSALRRHAESQIALSKIIMEEEEFNAEKLGEKIDAEEQANMDALLEVAYYCFIRTDPTVKGKSLDEAKEALSEWLDEGQLKRIPETAMGLNKLERPPVGAAL